MRTFAQMEAYLQSLAGMPSNLIIYPGPDLPDVPVRFVVLSRYGGPGEHFEGALDAIAWQVRVAGQQNNYNDAESLADLIDVGLLNIHSQEINGVWVSGCQRVGGVPSPLMVDDADRTHFVCSYILDTTLALSH